MFQRISLRGAEGEELFWGFSVLRSDPPPPISRAELPTPTKAPGNDNGGSSSPSHFRLAAARPPATRQG